MKLSTKRLVLRTLEAPDVTAKYIDWLNDPDVNQYLETRFENQTYESCLSFVKFCNISRAEYLFGIFEKNNNLNHIGNIKIGLINWNHKVGDISFFLGDKDIWGRGLAKEAIKKILKYSFDKIGLKKICAGCYEGNFGSLKVLMQCGFIVEGFLKEQVVIDKKRQGIFKLGLIADDCE